LSEPDASAAARVKAAMAIGGISASWMFFSAQMDKGELSKAVRGIAADIVELPA
jgi:hypothetical protein